MKAKKEKLRYAELFYAVTVSARKGESGREIRNGRYLIASLQNGREALELARRLFLGKENRSKVQIEIGFEGE